MDSLKFLCNWRGSVQGAKIPIKLGGLQLEGCVFDGNRLMENQRDSPIVSAIPACTVGWVSKVMARMFNVQRVLISTSALNYNPLF